MGETAQIILALLFTVAVFLATRVGIAWRIRRTGIRIAKELEAKGAFSPDSAKELPYEKTDWLRLGMRDFRPKALNALVEAGIVVRTEEGRFYLADTTFLGM